ncbi:MAG TPA: hypothetical protein VGE52_20885, partial [Pirellulales bacterium]
MTRTQVKARRRRTWAVWAICAAAFGPVALDAPHAWGYQEEAAPAEAAAPADGAAAAALPPPSNPNARILLESPPRTPEATVETVNLLADFQAPEHGKALLVPLLASPPDAAALVALYEKLGPAPITRLETTPSLQPQGREFAALVREAVRTRSRDPQYISGLIDRLDNQDRRIRGYVAVKLRDAGDAAYQPLIAALADPAREAIRSNIRQAIVVQGTDMGPALQAALATDDPVLAEQVTLALRDLRYRPAIPYLLAPAVAEETPAGFRDAARAVLASWLGAVPSPAEAVKAILGAGDAQYERVATPPMVDDDGKTVVWVWDAEKKEVAPKLLLLDDAYAFKAAQLGREAFKLAPDDPQVARFAAASALDAAMLENGLDKRPSEAALAAVEKVNDHTLRAVVAKAMGTRHTPAAAAAVTVLAERESRDALASPDGRLPLLVQAALDPDRRLRIAATEAIFGIEPNGNYVGASLVWEGLAQLITSTGKPKVVIAHHVLQHGQTLAGQLNELGYESDLAFSGKELFKKCAAQSDVELVVMSIGVIDPASLYALADLRRDTRTANLPVAVVADPEHMTEARRLADPDALASAIVRPVTPTQLTFLLRPLLERQARPAVVPAPERLEHAKRALALVAAASR